MKEFEILDIGRMKANEIKEKLGELSREGYEVLFPIFKRQEDLLLERELKDEEDEERKEEVGLPKFPQL